MSKRLAGCVYAMCLVDQRTGLFAKRVKRLLCTDAFFSEPSIEALNMLLATIIVSSENGLWGPARRDHEASLGLSVILAKDSNDLRINLNFLR